MKITLEYIQRLVANLEGVDVEFKETTGQLNRGMETLCGMMNGSGGIVVFGVTNKGKIIGQEVSDKTTREIGEALRKFDPSVDIQPTYVELDESGKYLIAFHSSGIESDKPYMWDGKPYQRHDSVTSVMPREKFFRLHELQHGLTYSWGYKTNPNLTIDSLDQNLIKRVVETGVRKGRLSSAALNDSVPDVLRRLELMKDGELCNAAAVLFGKDLTDYSQCMLRMARFKGTKKFDFLDNQRAEGNIFELVDAAMSFFFKHLMLSGTTHNRIYREDELEIPYDALREAISNALCHRNWQYESSTIGIAIYDDRIEIENAGHFPANLTPSRLATEEDTTDKNLSLPPNKTIAKAMFVGGLIENWGRGLAMMDNMCEEVGLPAPKIQDNGSFVWLTFTRPKPYVPVIENDKVAAQNDKAGFQNAQVAPQNDKVDGENDKVTAQNDKVDGENDKVSLGFDNLPNLKGKTKTRILEIIHYIGEDWFSLNELFEISGLKSKSSFTHTIIDRLLEVAIIRLEKPESPNAPNQRYGLTVKGKAIYYAQKEHK